jgi:hypothetical protein
MAAHCDVQGSKHPKQTLPTSGKLMAQEKSNQYHTVWPFTGSITCFELMALSLANFVIGMIAALKLNDASLPPDL